MTSLDHHALADALLGVVLAAGRVQMRYFDAGITVETKADDSPVTAADREAEAIILAGLRQAAPAVPVIAEEASSTGPIPDVGDKFFLVDPLDGTREFIHQRHEFTVNIALVVAKAPVFGIVYAPALGALYVTLGPGHAAYGVVAPQNDGLGLDDCDLAQIHTRQADPMALSAMASRSHGNAETEDFLGRYHIAERKSAGSSLKFCLLAQGQADIYPRLGPTMEWDTAAGHAVLSAAGGTVTRLDGSALTYGKRETGYLNPAFVAWGSHPLNPIPRPA